MAGVPQVVGYRMHPIDDWIVPRLVALEYASLPNILAGRKIIPERLFGACTAPGLAEALAAVGPAQIEAFDAEVLPRLRPPARMGSFGEGVAGVIAEQLQLQL